MEDLARDDPPVRVLLTGSQGGIGRHLVERFRAAGHVVRGLDRLAPADPGPDHHVGDLRDLDAVRRAARDVDVIIHAGAIPYDLDDGSPVIATNVLGTWNVMQAALESGVRRVVSFSSINALGSVGGWRPPDQLPIDDAYPAHPSTPYQLSKHLGEEICRSFSERHGIISLCLRPVWVTDPRRYAVDAFGSAQMLADWRDEYWAYVDVRDVGDAVMRCLSIEGVLHDRFLLSADDTSALVPTKDLVDREFPSVPWPAHDRDSYLAGSLFRTLIDCSHARSVLGWRPRHSWRDHATHPDHESEA